MGDPEVGSHPQPGVPILSFPLLHHKSIRQGCPHQPVATVWKAARGQEADQRRHDWLSQCREKLNH